MSNGMSSTDCLGGLLMVSSREHVSIYTVKDVPLFFQHFDGPFVPTLRVLHQCQSFFFLFFSTLPLRSDVLARSVYPSQAPD